MCGLIGWISVCVDRFCVNRLSQVVGLVCTIEAKTRDTLGSTNTLGSCMHPSKKHISRSPLRITTPLESSTDSSPAGVMPTKGAGPFSRKVS